MSAARSCPACGAELEQWQTVLPGEPTISQPIALERCTRCGSAVTAGPSVTESLYEKGAYAAGRPRGATLINLLQSAYDRQRLGLIRQHLPPPAKLLDVGAGRGRFVRAATEGGYDAEGIEPSEQGVRAAKDRYGVTLAPCSISSAEVPVGSMDVVSLWHVLEHLDDPTSALQRVHTWLRPGGVLLVGVPNVASLQARLGGARWYHFDVPRHRVHFTPAGLVELLRSRGFVQERVHHTLLEHNPFGMWQSLTNRATGTSSYMHHVIKRNAPLNARDLLVSAGALVLAPLAVSLEFVAGLARRGGTIAVTARRADV